jgi:hypothetical protein
MFALFMWRGRPGCEFSKRAKRTLLRRRGYGGQALSPTKEFQI